jgi:hypothetical protein
MKIFLQKFSREIYSLGQTREKVDVIKWLI